MAEKYKRRSPEEILAEIQKMRRGHHKIFVGAAPGVGKTYQMLHDAHDLKNRGVDVVAGIIETHGRPDTAKLVEGLEVIPRRQIEFKGIRLAEMDVDAIIARNPDVVLVDELAHTNIAGSRHPKRYDDVFELLDNGINVLSTLNIQHLESLNDTVRQITGVKVKETVPDSILEQADEIRLIDLSPEALIERLREGKIYREEVAHRALQNFFRKGNLTALRELSLRAVADDTDDRLEDYMHRHEISGTWRTKDRIMVSISSSPNGQNLIRRAFRTAKRLKAEFFVVYVYDPRKTLSAEDEKNLEANIQLAHDLDAKIFSLEGIDVAATLVRFVREHHISQLVMGESKRTRLQEVFYGSIINRVLRDTENVDILIVANAVVSAT